MKIKAIYNNEKVVGFLDASDPQETQDFLLQNYSGCMVSTNALEVADDHMTLPHYIHVIDGVASFRDEADALQFRAAEISLSELRKERNKRLAETDWWANSDLTMTSEQAAYRQALRDITQTYTSLEDVVWPTKPEV